MSHQAKVTSIDAIRDFAAALVEYRHAILDACESLGLESDRGVDWVQNDRPAYWPHRARQLDDNLAAAKQALVHCQTRVIGDQPASCIDEKKAVARLKHQLEDARGKVKATAGWRGNIEKDQSDFQTRLAQLVDYAELELPKAVAALERMVESLDKYAAKTEQPGKPARPTGGEE